MGMAIRATGSPRRRRNKVRLARWRYAGSGAWWRNLTQRTRQRGIDGIGRWLEAQAQTMSNWTSDTWNRVRGLPVVLSTSFHAALLP
jgi:hypothetical protein